MLNDILQMFIALLVMAYLLGALTVLIVWYFLDNWCWHKWETKYAGKTVNVYKCRKCGKDKVKGKK